jgi:hypothetical protein
MVDDVCRRRTAAAEERRAGSSCVH